MKSPTPARPRLKPNGQPMGTWLISIDDGWVEYRYKVRVSKRMCIEEVYARIRKMLRCRKEQGELRMRMMP